MIHRNHLAGLLAISLPWTFAWWPALLLPVAGLLYLRSMTAWLAAGAATVCYAPALWPLGLAVIPVGLWVRHRYPPGSLGDSVRSRLLSWLYLACTWSWKGHGVGSVRVPMEHAHIRSGGLAICGAPAHSEWIEVAYEWGAAGVGVVLATLGSLVWWVHPHHAASASAVAAALVLGGSSPIRAFVHWLRGGKPHLFGPPLRCTIMIHLAQDGRAYGPYVPHAEHDPDLQGRVGQALIGLGHQWMAAHPHIRRVEPQEVHECSTP